MSNPHLDESNPTSSFSLDGRPEIRTCGLCGRVLHRRDVVRATSVPPPLAEHLAKTHGDKWTGEGYVCRRCLNHARVGFVTERLAQERGELSKVEAEVAQKAGQHVTIAQNIDERFRRGVTRGQRAADAVARVGGSWTFVATFAVVLAAWMALNSRVLGRDAFDPYPYILLNLVLSCLAAIQAPIIMMAQNRAASRDRMEADEDFRTNLKAELEIASLHDKMDHLLHSQFERMAEMQEIQLELLTELAESSRRR